ncbi:RagB/SusD family nutrient uptake outer membrane protein [uncultured Mucilaginibacter sp.]|uniref:RagB/SusD family nutrient uptake outer membrane protein n=1 Tax=uncultured Mucilaginibacter sp. TaxID=797541 RepID=UPI0025D6C903|nr:RagB/SusD family nutrient uptake outer membrane protein [uncultured Mucilaginibacter sp.]
MKRKRIYITVCAIFLAGSITESCTKLKQNTYSVVPVNNFYQTPDQIAAGVAPAYIALQNIPDGNVNQMNEITSDEVIVPTRGGDWYDGGQWQGLWLHKFKPDVFVDGGWSDLNNGIGKVNFTLSILNGLAAKPSNYGSIVAELKVLRAYFFFQLTDMFGDIPLVTDYNTDPSKVIQVARKDVYTFLESELTTNVPLLATNVDKTTYGRVTQYAGYMLLAKLYLNAQVYTGTPQWTKAITALNQVINSGKYILQPNYFDNFSTNNDGSSENIFVVPFDKVNIGGNNWEMQTLHYSSNLTFGLTGQPWNGFCSTADVLNKYTDPADARKAQYLVGQQYAADGLTPLQDPQANLPVIFDPNITSLSDASGLFRMKGARNIKYHPEAGTSGGQSNDMVIFRLADAYLMLAEASLQNGDAATALVNVNTVRARAGAAAWTSEDVTLPNLLDERSRELGWEGWRRNDLIRYQVATGTHYFTGARTPAKVDDGDTHTFVFPIPSPELISNPNLHQNPGY